MGGRVKTVALVALLVLCVGGAVRAMEFEHRWVYVSRNLYVDDNVDAVVALMSRSKKAGYTGMVLSDSKFGRLPQMDRRYFDNVARVVEAGRKLKFDIIPTVFPIGYSNSILSQDVNLAAGVPVKGARFVVEDGAARPVVFALGRRGELLATPVSPGLGAQPAPWKLLELNPRASLY